MDKKRGEIKMQPIPCAHCGINFMRHNINSENEKLCNNCIVREEIRNPKKEKIMDMVEILIKCPRKIQINVEEICINQGIDFSRYFLNLHEANISNVWNVKEHIEKGGQWEEEGKEEITSESDSYQKNKKKNKKD